MGKNNTNTHIKTEKQNKNMYFIYPLLSHKEKKKNRNLQENERMTHPYHFRHKKIEQ